MKQITCPHCGDTYPDFDVAHVCSKGPYAPKLKPKLNERILELSKQAGDYVNEVYTGPVRSKTPGKIWEDGHVGWHTQFNQKFAQLIVQECLQISDEFEIDVNQSGLVSRIAQHFGVEE